MSTATTDRERALHHITEASSSRCSPAPLARSLTMIKTALIAAATLALAAPATASAHMRSCGPLPNGVGVVANEHTSCAFAKAIFRKSATVGNMSYDRFFITVRSPTTHKRYRIAVRAVLHGRSGSTELVATGPNGIRAALRS